MEWIPPRLIAPGGTLIYTCLEGEGRLIARVGWEGGVRGCVWGLVAPDGTLIYTCLEEG